MIWLWCITFCHRNSITISILMNCTSLNSHYVWHQIYIFYCDGTAGRIVHAFLSWETKKVEEGVEGTANVYRELKVDITSLFDWKHCHSSLKKWSFHPIPLFESKKVSFDEFERLRTRRKKESHIPCLNVMRNPYHILQGIWKSPYNNYMQFTGCQVIHRKSP